MKKVYAILVKASRVVVLDADTESEAQKIAMSLVEFDSDHTDEAETHQRDLSETDIESDLRHGAQDLREAQGE